MPHPRPTPAAARPHLPRRLASIVAGHPRNLQRGAFLTMFGVLAAFVVTSTSAPVAGVVAQRHAVAPRRVAVAAPVTPMPAGVALAQAPVPASKVALHPRSGRSTAPAPVDHGVISGLAANGIPSVALNAYRVAAARMADVEPSCGIPWYLLAAIGREESDHGRFGGAVLHADGVSTPEIIGPALDGKRWDLVPAPGNGLALDGDAKYAHALGPMQFIPSTWALYGADANGDGKADIFNINDAALGAARYLCAAGGDLTTTAGRTRAVLSYNHNDQYLAQVLALADAYRKGIAVTGIPVGITKGSLPTVTDTGYIPPANPGAPTAVDPTKSASPTPVTSTAPKGTSGSTKPPSSAAPSATPTGAKGGSGTTRAPSPSPSRSQGSPTPTPTSAPSTSTPPSCTALAQLLGMCKPS